MKANVKRPARFSFKTITEKKAKHLTLIFVAVLFLVIVVLALFPLLDREDIADRVSRRESRIDADGTHVCQDGVNGIGQAPVVVRLMGMMRLLR